MILELTDKQFMNQQSISLSVQPVGKNGCTGQEKATGNHNRPALPGFRRVAGGLQIIYYNV